MQSIFGMAPRWQVTALIAAALAGAALTSCGEPVDPGGGNIQRLYPDIEVSSTALDFEDSRVGYYFYRGVTIGNYGRANLEIEEFLIEGDERSAFSYTLDQSVLAPGGAGTLRITYTPPEEGEDTATLTFGTNDPETPSVSLTLRGNGTIPSLQIDPAPPVVFSDVSVGTSRYADLLVTNGGTGKLTLNSIAMPVEFQGDFSLELPPTFVPGKQLGVGELLGIRITYHPDAETGDTADTGYVVIDSDDPRHSRFEVNLLGSTQAEPIDLPPVIHIVTPDPLEPVTTVYVGHPVVFEAEVTDTEDKITNLPVNWYSSLDGYIGTTQPGEDGYVSLVTSALSVGEHVIRATVQDSSANSARDEVEVKVWNEESDFDYVIAGYQEGAAETAFRYFEVDDNIEIFRTDAITGDVVPCLVVKDDILNNLSPAVCNAHIGDTLRIIVYDRYADKGRIDGLNLFFGEDKQRLIEEYTITTGAGGELCQASPTKRDWYAEHDVPYTDDCVILDVSVEVTIPLTPVE